jgi:hypothetical protein
MVAVLQMIQIQKGLRSWLSLNLSPESEAP